MTIDDLERTVRRIAPAVLRFATGLASDRDLGADVAQEALAAEKVSIELQRVPAHDAVTALLDLVGAELVEVSAEPRRLAVRRRR